MAAPLPAHFNHAGTSIPDPAVVGRVVDHLRLEARIGGYEAAERVADELVAGRQALGAVLGVPADDVVLVESATQAWVAVVWALALSLGWGPDDQVVVDQFAYVSSWAVLERVRQVVGIQLVVAPARPDGTVDPSRLAEVVGPSTRLVLLTHVPTHLGTVSPLAEAAAVLGRLDHDAVVALDVSQSLGQLPVDVTALCAQVAFAPGRKFLRAPRGTGVLTVASTLADRVVPLGLDLTATTRVWGQGFEAAPGAQRFELFEHSLALRLGLGRAARQLLDAGVAAVAAAVGQRTQAVLDLVAATPGLALVAPAPLHGIVSFTHEHLDPTEVRHRLSQAGVNAWTNVANGSPLDGEVRHLGPSVRLSPHATTTDADLEALERALGQLG